MLVLILNFEFCPVEKEKRNRGAGGGERRLHKHFTKLKRAGRVEVEKCVPQDTHTKSLHQASSNQPIRYGGAYIHHYTLQVANNRNSARQTQL